MTNDTREYAPRQRAALVAWHLAHGDSMTNAEIATMTGLRPDSAYRLMCLLSSVLPLYQDDFGVWQVACLREFE